MTQCSPIFGTRPPGEINQFVRNGVILLDGTFRPADVILYCTGYVKSYDYFEADLRSKLDVQNDGLYLYRNCLPPRLPHLAFVGSEVSTYANILTYSLQAQWLTHVLTGAVQLPGRDAMMADIQAQRRWRRKVMPAQRSRSSVVMMYGIQYHDQLLRDMGHLTKRKGRLNPLAECFRAYLPVDYSAAVEGCSSASMRPEKSPPRGQETQKSLRQLDSRSIWSASEPSQSVRFGSGTDPSRSTRRPQECCCKSRAPTPPDISSAAEAVLASAPSLPAAVPDAPGSRALSQDRGASSAPRWNLVSLKMRMTSVPPQQRRGSFRMSARPCRSVAIRTLHMSTSPRAPNDKVRLRRSKTANSQLLRQSSLLDLTSSGLPSHCDLSRAPSLQQQQQQRQLPPGCEFPNCSLIYARESNVTLLGEATGASAFSEPTTKAVPVFASTCAACGNTLSTSKLMSSRLGISTNAFQRTDTWAACSSDVLSSAPAQVSISPLQCPGGAEQGCGSAGGYDGSCDCQLRLLSQALDDFLRPQLNQQQQQQGEENQSQIRQQQQQQQQQKEEEKQQQKEEEKQQQKEEKQQQKEEEKQQQKEEEKQQQKEEEKQQQKEEEKQQQQQKEKQQLLQHLSRQVISLLSAFRFHPSYGHPDERQHHHQPPTPQAQSASIGRMVVPTETASNGSCGSFSNTAPSVHGQPPSSRQPSHAERHLGSRLEWSSLSQQPLESEIVTSNEGRGHRTLNSLLGWVSAGAASATRLEADTTGGRIHVAEGAGYRIGAATAEMPTPTSTLTPTPMPMPTHQQQMRSSAQDLSKDDCSGIAGWISSSSRNSATAGTSLHRLPRTTVVMGGPGTTEVVTEANGRQRMVGAIPCTGAVAPGGDIGEFWTTKDRDTGVAVPTVAGCSSIDTPSVKRVKHPTSRMMVAGKQHPGTVSDIGACASSTSSGPASTTKSLHTSLSSWHKPYRIVEGYFSGGTDIEIEGDGGDGNGPGMGLTVAEDALMARSNSDFPESSAAVPSTAPDDGNGVTVDSFSCGRGDGCDGNGWGR
ncbi:hypothetical protein Vafri_7014 [Volvox africanus]|uniref:Flavin-containing monooxygenase n=1 Tax=Volvox africanus TaxID=51714 RepID=A0A8J4AZZ0_9CHLO|nr:hypothetical protein Vafri_7014 [Volvox africanus]